MLVAQWSSRNSCKPANRKKLVIDKDFELTTCMTSCLQEMSTFFTFSRSKPEAHFNKSLKRLPNVEAERILQMDAFK